MRGLRALDRQPGKSGFSNRRAAFTRRIQRPPISLWQRASGEGPVRPGDRRGRRRAAHCDNRSCRRQITMVTATKPAMTTTASTISQHPLSPQFW
jgi:hypothetical protein